MRKKYFIRTKGKEEFKTFHLINIENFDMLDMFFNSELEAKEYAFHNSIDIVEFKEIFNQE